jgi:hypothetical protein
MIRLVARRNGRTELPAGLEKARALVWVIALSSVVAVALAVYALHASTSPGPGQSVVAWSLALLGLASACTVVSGVVLWRTLARAGHALETTPSPAPAASAPSGPPS